MQKAITISLLTIILLKCTVSFKLKKITIDSSLNPPGTIKIDTNLYFDQTQVTNQDYMEYMFWTKSIFGKKSTRYTNIIPDTNVWSKLNESYTSLDTFYLRHPIYRSYPVVGVSYSQAKDYSNWRSDRVMEMILVKNEIIPYISKPHKDSIFTIEKYFSGNYHDIQPLEDFFIYPYYSLPDSVSYSKATFYINYSNNKKNLDYIKTLNNNCIEKTKNYSGEYPYGIDPIPTISYPNLKIESVTHLNGNTRELTNIEGLYFGKSFIDSCSLSSYIFRKDSIESNSYTGFRNICEYRKWDK